MGKLEDNSLVFKRRESILVKAGNLSIGGGSPVSVQSMTNTPTADVKATLKQIEELASAGCEIVRLGIPDDNSLVALKEICSSSPLPVVADIHFNHKYALKAIDAGVKKLRINPGNIGSFNNVREVALKAKDNGIPIRIGVNGGSLEKDLLQKYGGPTPEAMVESGLRHVALLEKADFQQIVISLKASDVLCTVAAYRMMAKKVEYPLHIGITEAGTVFSGAIRSAAGLGILLSEGIGDTVRVSLTGSPVEEVKAAYILLECLGLRKDFVRIISCPTCARTSSDVEKMANEVEKALEGVRKNLHVAVMGCAVNGPGEARGADYGIACGKGEGLIFSKGEIVGKYPDDIVVKKLLEIIKKSENIQDYPK